eukprot:6183674-Pleurochrysis_carterae.AAC.2
MGVRWECAGSALGERSRQWSGLVVVEGCQMGHLGRDRSRRAVIANTAFVKRRILSKWRLLEARSPQTSATCLR